MFLTTQNALFYMFLTTQNALFYIFQGVPNALFYIFQGIRQPIISHIIIPNWFAANIQLISETAKENSVYFATKPFFAVRSEINAILT